MLNLELWHVVLTIVVLLFLGAFVGGRIAILRSLTQTDQKPDHDVKAMLDETVHMMMNHPPAESTQGQTQ